jgi:hypothetical protein
MDLRDISNAWQSGIVVNQLRIAFSKTKIPNQSPCGKRRLLFKLDLKKRPVFMNTIPMTERFSIVVEIQFF